MRQMRRHGHSAAVPHPALALQREGSLGTLDYRAPAISGGPGLEHPSRSVTPPTKSVTVRAGGSAVVKDRAQRLAPDVSPDSRGHLTAAWTLFVHCVAVLHLLQNMCRI